MLRFVHEFEEDPQWGDLSVDLDPPSGAKIEFTSGDDGIWVAANGSGFLHLARIFAELGTRSLEPGYHFHRGYRFNELADEKALEVSIELSRD